MDGRWQRAIGAVILLCSQSILTAVPTIEIFSEAQNVGIPLEGIAIDPPDRFRWWSEEDGHRLLGVDPLNVLQHAGMHDAPYDIAAGSVFHEIVSVGHPHNLTYITANWAILGTTANSLSIDQRLVTGMFWGEMAAYQGDSSLRLPRWTVNPLR